MSNGKLRKQFTNSEINGAFAESNGSYTEAARRLSELRGLTISRELVRYWVQHLDTRRPNGEPYVGTTVLDRQIREEMELRVPSPNDDEKLIETGFDNSRILNIPDQHAPYQHPDALEFLADVAAKLRPTRVINLGDETDGHAMSFHDSDPNLDSAGVELEKAKEFIQALAKMFPIQDVCHSNHGSLIYRRALKYGIPTQYIKTYRDILFPDGGGEGGAGMSVYR